MIFSSIIPELCCNHCSGKILGFTFRFRLLSQYCIMRYPLVVTSSTFNYTLSPHCSTSCRHGYLQEPLWTNMFLAVDLVYAATEVELSRLALSHWPRQDRANSHRPSDGPSSSAVMRPEPLVVVDPWCVCVRVWSTVVLSQWLTRVAGWCRGHRACKKCVSPVHEWQCVCARVAALGLLHAICSPQCTVSLAAPCRPPQRVRS